MRLLINIKRLFLIYPFYLAYKLLISYLYILIRNRIFPNFASERLLSFKAYFPDRATFFSQFTEIFLYGTYIIPIKSAIPNILDCGSNIGMSVLYFKWRIPEAHITCIEPNPEALEYLYKNISENHLESITVLPYALADRDGEASFFSESKTKASKGAGLFQRDDLKALRRVEIRRLSQYIDARVDLLKIDVEGAEELVLQDLIETGKISYIQNLIAEYHFNLRQNRDTLERFVTRLKDEGFQTKIVDQYASSACLIYAVRP